jgi:hypothetical protein
VSAPQISHSWRATVPVQVPVNVSGEPSSGVVLLAASVHVGASVAGGCQLSVTVAAGPVPLPLLATMP